MNLNIAFKAEQKLNQVMSPAQLQSLRILQMPLAELRAEIHKELEENPLLEWSDPDPDTNVACNTEQTDTAIERDDADDENEDDCRPIGREAGFDVLDWYPHTASIHSELRAENRITKEETFKDFLVAQLTDLQVDKKTLSLCRYLIECLNDRGYLDESTEELAAFLHMPVADIDDALDQIHMLKPCGVGARDLKECLKLQLRYSGRCNETILRMIDNFLEPIAQNKVKEISRALKIDLKTVIEYCNRIKSLNPIPSRGFNTETAEAYIIPEAVIVNDGDGLSIQMNDNFLPAIHISSFYKEAFWSEKDQETHEFLRKRMAVATALVRGIRMRNETLYRILRSIVELQDDYFKNGSLKPMKILDVADALNLNISTISRAIQGKYILCRYGTVSLKSLFSSAIDTTSGSAAVSSFLVKQKIKYFIDREDKSRPLSDDKICELLTQCRILISRRTIAKYREEMQIRPSSGRRIQPKYE